MKLIYTILLLICFNANATVFYVSNTGSDSNNGTTELLSWRTIAHVNAQTFAQGDYILFKRGDSWNERLNPPSSGAIGSVITFGAYGTGLKPIITGFMSATMENQGGNIWKGVAVGNVQRQNTVLIDGLFRGKGRYPNSTYLYTSNAGDTYTRIITSFTDTPNYTGGELVTFGYNWIIDVNKIARHAVDTMYLDSAVTYPVTGYRYFVQNLPSLCDEQYEWSINNDTITVYSTTEPTVLYSSIDTLIDIQGKNYLEFNGLHITGANSSGIYLDSTDYTTIQNCTIDFIGGSNPQPQTMSGLAGAAIRGENPSHLTINNDSILHSLNDGIFLIRNPSNCTITNNYIKNTSMIVGLGAGGNGAGNAIYYAGNGAKIEGNRIDSVGYVGVWFGGESDTVYHNYITNFAVNKEDGGGIYTAHGAPSCLIRSNIVTGGIGSIFIAAGIYLDDNTYGVRVDSNTTFDTKYYGLFLHISNKVTATDNTIVTDRGVVYATEGSSSNGGAGPSYIYRNIFYSKSASFKVMSYGYAYPLTPGYFYQDSNYYLRPILETNKYHDAITGLSYSTAQEWSVPYGLDTHSFDTPNGITTDGALYINPTLSDSTVNFTGTKIDAKGVLYNGTVTILPYQSKLLFNTTSQSSNGVRKIGFLNFQ